MKHAAIADGLVNVFCIALVRNITNTTEGTDATKAMSQL